jgi:hypothetical protein
VYALGLSVDGVGAVTQLAADGLYFIIVTGRETAYLVLDGGARGTDILSDGAWLVGAPPASPLGIGSAHGSGVFVTHRTLDITRVTEFDIGAACTFGPTVSKLFFAPVFTGRECVTPGAAGLAGNC